MGYLTRIGHHMSELITRNESGNYVIPAGADVTQLNYRDLVNSEQVYRIPGFGLVTDKATLIGVPHIIVGVTFQMPLADKSNEFGARDYVTLRAMVGDEEALNEALERGWIPGNKSPFRANELICYNDGSTGIRRDVVKMLDSAKLITVGNEDTVAANRYDAPWSLWTEFTQSVQQGENVVPEFVNNHNGQQFLIHSNRGLRASSYTNEFGDSTTYYL